MSSSDKRTRILKCIREFIDDRGYPPTIAEVQRGCAISCKSVVEYHLGALERQGLIRRDAETSGGIEASGNEELEKAEARLDKLDRMEKKLQRLRIIDEVGYVPLDPVVSYFVFSLVCRRYEKGAMIWTSNKGFAEWASVFAGDEVLTAAILDRLLHHGTVVNIRGRSYRLRDKIQAGTVAAPITTATQEKRLRNNDGRTTH